MTTFKKKGRRHMSKRSIVLLIGTIGLIVAGYFILPVSLPLIVAFITAICLAPFVRLCIKYVKVNRMIAVLLVFAAFLVFLLGIGYLLITVVIAQGTLFLERLPTYITNINEAWNGWLISLEALSEQFPQEMIVAINSETTHLLDNLRTSVSQIDVIGISTSVMASIPGYFISFLVFIIALFLFLLELPRIQAGFYHYLTSETKQKVHYMLQRFSGVIIGFLKAQFIVSIPIFLVSLIGLFIIVPEVALIMALIIWIIDFIPLIGSIVILAPWAIYQMFMGQMTLGIQLLVLAAVLLIIRRTVEPKVMGTHIGLSPLLTLISMYLGARLLGVMGLFLGPLLVIAFTSAKEAGMIRMKGKI